MKRLAVVVVLLASAIAAADAVPDLVKLIENQPNDMDRSVWKEKRRDAARKLAQSKDKKAVPELEKLAESETFDIIGEIAIEGLGTLGDSSAVPTLQKIAADESREKSQRDLAKKSLAKLGASATATKPPERNDKPPEKPPERNDKPPEKPVTGLETATNPTGTATTATTTTVATADGAIDSSTGSHLIDSGAAKPAADMPALPELPDDTLAAYDRITFAGGTASVAYDTGRKRLDAAADLSGLWQHRIERDAMAWGADAGAHLVTGLINPDGRAQTRGAQLDVNADGEARFYSGQVYGIGRAAASLQVDYISDVDAMNAMNDYKQTTTLGDLQVALGGGYGRVLDVGAAIRVRRLARTLDAARALGKPIDAATSKKLQLMWWALRGERSTYRSLVATVAILREAGILLGEPDAGLAYEILNVLRDTQLFVRPSGLDINVTFGEGYLRRPAGLVAQDFENGRVEQLLVNAGYGTQLDDDKLEIAGTAYARYRLFAADGTPAPYGAGATAHMTRYTYGDHGDPFGMFDLTGIVEVSSDDRMNTDKGLHLEGQLGFTMLFNQASGLRLAGSIAEDGGTIFFGANLQATYGLLDAVFAR
ncbi:MAG TPA: HEAT repeat domain-containing protein [Kofleriaceae bacterium]|nr:HEAT repeat domain-containing protein [Kofleriaceae bacterium]